jgi:hypothetical protein
MTVCGRFAPCVITYVVLYIIFVHTPQRDKHVTRLSQLRDLRMTEDDQVIGYFHTLSCCVSILESEANFEIQELKRAEIRETEGSLWVGSSV